MLFGKEDSVLSPQHLQGIDTMNPFVEKRIWGNLAQAEEAQGQDGQAQGE